ncbi:MAG: helix-turn-helix transcriptional regulator [Pseudomonadota bacterium]
MAISIEQIKAARALLEWTQEDLANQSGLSKPAINMIERRLSNAKADTLEAVQKAFEKAGVEFISGPGVRLKSTILKTEIFEGSDSLLRLLRDVFQTLNGTESELLISGIDENLYKNIGGQRVVKEIEKRIKHGIKTKLLSCEGDTNFLEPIEHYRWIPKEFFSTTPSYIYGDKYAILLWGPPQKVVVIENSEIADSFRKQFLSFWASASIPKV